MEMRYYFGILYVSLAHISRKIAPFRCVLGETRPHLPTLFSNHMCVFLTTTFVLPIPECVFLKDTQWFLFFLFSTFTVMIANILLYILNFIQIYKSFQVCLRIDEGSRCVLRYTYALLITLMAFLLL